MQKITQKLSAELTFFTVQELRKEMLHTDIKINNPVHIKLKSDKFSNSLRVQCKVGVSEKVSECQRPTNLHVEYKTLMANPPLSPDI